ncbi:MauE/DoxX family redox-associated membrane protein [Streptomyces sp. NPDC021093]|uniref:MauE/DoxX family redox-associated membrane protein n=1 Tax=Streptomyces sp. NPDC021093 TaxID=3365112 RepID=UPI00379006EA
MEMPARYLLLVILVSAAAGKSLRPGTTRTALAAAGLSPRAGTVLLIGAEALLAALLVLPGTAYIGACGALGLLTAFTIFAGWAVATGRFVPCGCFGRAGAPMSRRTVARNGALVLVAALAMGAPPGGMTWTAVVVPPAVAVLLIWRVSWPSVPRPRAVRVSTGPGRRMLLVAAVSSLLAACTGRGSTPLAASSSAPRAPSAKPPATATPDCPLAVDVARLPANGIEENDCKAVGNYRETVGVQDEEGNGHPQYAGWTIARYSFDTAPPLEEVRNVTKVRCRCNGKEYDSASACLADCRTSLGCFTGICEPAGDQVCIEATLQKVTFKAVTTVYALEWEPTRALSAVCKRAVCAWRQRVIRHEAQHVRDARALVVGAGEAMEGKRYEACAATRAEARVAVEAVIKAALKAEADQLGDEFERISEEWHKTPAGKPIPDFACTTCA